MTSVMGMIEAYESQARFCERNMSIHFNDRAVYSFWSTRRQCALKSSEQLEELAARDIDRDTRTLVGQAA